MCIIYSAAPTPFNENGDLDKVSFKRMIDKNIADGIKGFFLAGNMGEWSQYGPEIKMKLAEYGVKQAAGRAEILMGITETGLRKTLDTMRDVSLYVPDAYVVMLPHQTMTLVNPLKYLKTILDAADRPVYYYHCPVVNTFNFSPADFEVLVQHPNLKGIKNSAGDVGVRRELLLLKQKYDFVLLEGHEWSIDEAVFLGCDGALCGLAALAGKLMVKTAELTATGNTASAMREQYKLINIYHGIYGINTARVQNAHKYALYQLGIFENYHCLLRDDKELTDDDKKRIEQCLKKYQSEW